MYTFVFTQRQYSLLKKILKSNIKFLFARGNEPVTVLIPIKKLNFIADKVSDFYVDYGLKKNDEPNELGVEINAIQELFLEKIG